MSFTLDATGLTIQTYDEIVAELVAGYQSVYGADINVLPDSPGGQQIGIEAKARLDLQAAVLSIYNQMDPDLSAGESLNKLIKLAGLARGIPTRSSVAVNVTADRSLALPIGYSVADDAGQLWVTDSAAALVAGVNAVTLFAADFGDVAAGIGTVTSPASVVLGVTAVTNPAIATPGVAEETDAALRARRNRSLVSPSTSSRGGMFTALGALVGVTDLAVYENDTDALDVTLNLEPHAIWCIVEGGDVADIVQAIALNKTAGTGLKGTVAGSYLETAIKPDGTSYVMTHAMVFDRPTVVPLYVHVTVQGLDGITVDDVGVANALAAHSYTITEGASASALYVDVYSVSGPFVATALQISDDDTTYTADNIVAAADGVFSISAANVTVTVLP